LNERRRQQLKSRGSNLRFLSWCSRIRDRITVRLQRPKEIPEIKTSREKTQALVTGNSMVQTTFEKSIGLERRM